MNVSDYKSQLTTIKIALEAIIGGYDSHERRNERLSALQRVIEHFKGSHNWNFYRDGWQSDMDTFQAVYELCIWQLNHETHTCVKNRLRLAIDILNRKLTDIDRKENPDKYSRFKKKESSSDDQTPLDMDDIAL